MSKRPEWKDEIVKKKCRYCMTKENLTIDHKNPVSKGGTNDIRNLQVLCERCNGFKSNFTHGQMKAFIKWVLTIQESRVANGKKPYQLKTNNK